MHDSGTGNLVMPVIKIEHISEDSVWGLWKIEEDQETLLRNAVLSGEEVSEMDRIANPRRKTEWLASRVMLKTIMDSLGIPYRGLRKNEASKPYLVNDGFHISLAHSFPIAGAMVNRNSPCGIDIEKPKPALFTIATKFLSDEEWNTIPKRLPELCLAWAVKEVLYKLYGDKRISFRENLVLHPFIYSPKGRIRACIRRMGESKSVNLGYEQAGDMMVCYSL